VDVRFGTWNVSSHYRVHSVKAVARQLARYNLDLVAVQEVRWAEGGSQPADDQTFFSGSGNANLI
jgi:exonuclease III